MENEYAWSDGVSPVLYTNWNENEPNNVGGAVSTAHFKSPARPWCCSCAAASLSQSVDAGTLRGHEPQPPGDGQVERRRLPQESQLRLHPDEMSVKVLFKFTNQMGFLLLFFCKCKFIQITATQGTRQFCKSVPVPISSATVPSLKM